MRVPRIPLVVLVWMMAMATCLTFAVGQTKPTGAQQDKAPAAEPQGGQVVIETTSLPGTYPHALYEVHLQAKNGTTPFRWKVEKGDLPPGLKLEEDGRLHGSPEKGGEYRFAISVTDNSRPVQAVQREYVLNVVEAISMVWKVAPRVVGGRIEGSVMVTNTTEDELDFTFVVLAVNENGRATALGYQRFPLKTRTVNFEIPFGENLPHGAYVVHADGVGEMAAKNQIHRTRLQTPAALQVVVGP
jgi:hypothetical protein